jgi:hypothetical protein
MKKSNKKKRPAQVKPRKKKRLPASRPPIGPANMPSDYAAITAAARSLTHKLTEFFLEQDRRLFEAGLSEFFMEDFVELSDEDMDLYAVAFWPWVFYTMTFEEEDIDYYNLEGKIPPNTTIAEMFERQSHFRLTHNERKYLVSAYRRPFCFYEVLKVIPGKGLKVTDLITHQRHLVTDISSSNVLEPGQVIYGQLATIDDRDIFTAAWPRILPHRFLIEILKFRDQHIGDSGCTDEEAFEMDVIFRELMWQMCDALAIPPALQNTDGEPLSFRTLHYTVESAEVAFQALHSLNAVHSLQDLRQGARLDDQGNIEHVQFNWARLETNPKKALQNTTLADITLTGTTMTVEVNSKAREQAIRRHIHERLGDKAQYLRTDTKSVEAALREHREKGGSRSREDEDLQQHPEVQKALREMMERHWAGWMDEPIPALDGQTPRQAMRTKSGRQRLEVLIREAEIRDAKAVPAGLQQPIIDNVRKELGLERESDADFDPEG